LQSLRPTSGCTSQYNIAGLISEVSEEVATQIAKNCSRQPPHSHLTPEPRGTPASIRMYTLYFQKLESLAYIFVAESMGLSLFKFVQWAPKDASFLHQSAFWPLRVVHGHPRSMILVPIESAYATSYSWTFDAFIVVFFIIFTTIVLLFYVSFYVFAFFCVCSVLLLA